MEDPPLLSEMRKPATYCWIMYSCMLAAKKVGEILEDEKPSYGTDILTYEQNRNKNNEAVNAAHYKTIFKYN